MVHPGNNQISLFGEKTYCGVIPISEAEYMAARRSCPQSVWMKQMLNDYNVEQDVLTFYCVNLSTINILKSIIQYSRTKHIDVKFHSIRDLIEEKVVTIEHVATEEQLIDIFTKALDCKQFEKLRAKLEIFLHEEI